MTLYRQANSSDVVVRAARYPWGGWLRRSRVVLRPSHKGKVSEGDIIDFCRGHLARFKVPRAVVFGELPKTSTGKIQKFELRKQAGSAGAIDV